MKKNRLKMNNYRAKSTEKCPDQISEDDGHPPLFCSHTWTECAPISHRFHLMHPSMSIGRNYRLGLDKKLREINKLSETTMSIKILDEDRHLLHCPRQKSKSKIKKPSKTNTTTADYKCPGVVPLADLLSGKYHRDKAERRQQEKMAKKIKNTMIKAQILPTNFIGSSLNACNAMTPDEQLNVLKAMWKKQENVEIGMRKEDIETIKYYLNEGISSDFYNPFPEQVIENIKENRIEPNLLKK